MKEFKNFPLIEHNMQATRIIYFIIFALFLDMTDFNEPVLMTGSIVEFF